MAQFNFLDWVGEHGILGQSGFYHVILPFLLLFVIIFGILQMLGLFGAKGKKINGIVSLILALFITYSTPYLLWFSTFVATFTGFMAVVLLGFLFLLLLFGLLTGKRFDELFKDKEGRPRLWIWLLIAVVVAFFIFRQSGGLEQFIPGLGAWSAHISAQTIILFIIVAGLIALVAWVIFGKEKEG